MTLTRAQIAAMTLPQLQIAVAKLMEPKPPTQDVKTLRSMIDGDWRYSVAYLYSTGGRWRVNVGTDADEKPEWFPFYDYPNDIGAAFLLVDWVFEHAGEAVYAAFHASLKDQLGTQSVRPSSIMAICICRAVLCAVAAESEKR